MKHHGFSIDDAAIKLELITFLFLNFARFRQLFMMAKSQIHLTQLLAIINLFCIIPATAASNTGILQSPSSQCSLRKQTRTFKGSIEQSSCPLAFLFQYKSLHKCSYADNPCRQTSNPRISRYTNHPRNIQSQLFHSNTNQSQELLKPSSTSSQSSSSSNNNELSRRTILLNLLTLTTLTQLPQSSVASSQIDASGQLYSPKSEMLSRGGSAAARGIKLPKKERAKASGGDLLKKSGLIQDVYETRFVAYLTRFLLNFDPAAGAWWKVCCDCVYILLYILFPLIRFVLHLFILFE
jgi:hypothetical protein